MKFLYLKIIILCILINYSCADRSLFTGPGIDPGLGGVYTELTGSISGTLKKADSPYLIISDIVVDSSQSLIIEEGVTLFFKIETQLRVHGKITAVGKTIEPITFTAFETDWMGIHIISPTNNSTFKFCVIEYVYLPREGIVKYGAVEIENASAEISNCIFQTNYSMYGGGLALLNSDVTVTNNIFYDNEADVYGGAILSDNSSNKIINNTIYRNWCLNFGGGFVFVEPVFEDIQNNIFYKNYSPLGDPRIEIVSGDTNNVSEQYNFLASGTMNPEFISETNLNLHLDDESLCIDAGNPEPIFNDFDGTRNDQGAYGGPNGDW
jgi:hypothetical protein